MRRILIANRGEIACRIIRTCRRMGIQTIAVHSPVDAKAMHVQQADASFALPGDAPRDGYSNVEAILAAARAISADAIHPGYGFLSEKSAFAQAADAAGLTWIGPRAQTIEDMGSKSRARDLAMAAGVPVLPGTGAIAPADAGSASAMAQTIGFPLLVKASAGGGGIGMKLVDDPSALTAAIKSVQAHAERLYGDPIVFLEKVVARARHIEVQVFGFGDGEAIHLHGRECSIQRRYQKVIEESTGPTLDSAQLKRMYDAALSLVRQQRYSGAGTVEFLYDDLTHEFYFLEMNTRIQVEHAVSEMITGLDLVEMQIRQASGEAMTEMRGAEVKRHGHSIECRLYAEDPSRSFYPSPGPLHELVLPVGSDTVRVDTGVQSGDVVTPFYDPMISKIVCWGETRPLACEAMQAALEQVKVVGVKTNLTLLRSILSHPEFLAGHTHTRFIEDHASGLVMQAPVS